MKFQKGILDDAEPDKGTLKIDLKDSTLKPVGKNPTKAVETESVRPPPDFAEKDRLFQTVKEETGSDRKYLKLLGIVAVFVAIAGGAAWYMMRPGIGDPISKPKGLEAALRDHFQLKEKREATDIVFYNCGDFVWSRVDVVIRPDIKTNPVYQIGKYTARSVAQPGGSWQITATPISSPEMDVPCK